MSKARYIIDSIDKGTSMGRAKDILSKFDELDGNAMKAQNELLVAIQDWIKKQKIEAEVERSPKGSSVIVTADRATRKDIDSALYKIYGNGYKVTSSDKFSTYELK